MKRNSLLVAAVLTLIVSGSTRANLLGVDWILGPHQHPDGQHTTFQIVVSFNDPNDQIFAVSCGMGIDLDFWTSDGSDIYNQEQFAGLPFNDFPSAPGLGGELWDSYVTIGATTFPSNTQFTPDFLGPWGGVPPPQQVIVGSELNENDGAWFFFGDAPFVSDLEDAVADNKTFDIVVAQFTVDEGVNIYLSSNIGWFEDGVGRLTTFEVDTAPPCPWDLDDSGFVSIFDLLELFSQWGTDGPGDFDESGAVGGFDLITLLANWGPCP
ncbi:MAG: hypothetical protein IH984_13345 [Planctomycetes bacterium]|nr:hypothetical protein [Planctomycetota bacterium]